MANSIHQESFIKRAFHYAKVWVTDRNDTRNYNIQAQRILADAGAERNALLRYYLYHMFRVALFFDPSNLKEETVVAYVNQLAKEPSLTLRTHEFKVFSFRFVNVGSIIRTETLRTKGIQKALQDALYAEQQGLKPFPEGGGRWHAHNRVVGYIQSILDKFEPVPKPPNRAERRRAAKQNRRRGGPSE